MSLSHYRSYGHSSDIDHDLDIDVDLTETELGTALTEVESQISNASQNHNLWAELDEPDEIDASLIAPAGPSSPVSPTPAGRGWVIRGGRGFGDRKGKGVGEGEYGGIGRKRERQSSVDLIEGEVEDETHDSRGKRKMPRRVVS